jgi:hypothetical protein
MSQRFEFPVDLHLNGTVAPDARSADRRLKHLRYVIAVVNDEAVKTWNDLWAELQPGVTPGGLVLPAMDKGFKPSCGWAEFLEKFWLLKHYLDYTHRSCEESAGR